MQSRIHTTFHAKRKRFFRLRLLTASPEAVQKYLDSLEKEVEGIKKSALTMAWYMRGGASYEDVLNMSVTERKQINELIDEHMDITKKTQLPFY